MKIIFHCATVTPTAENTKNKVLTYMVNVGGTQNVIQVSADLFGCFLFNFDNLA